MGWESVIVSGRVVVFGSGRFRLKMVVVCFYMVAFVVFFEYVVVFR